MANQRKGSMRLVEVTREEALDYHRVNRGKIETAVKVPMADSHDLALAYTPGVAEPCLEIRDDRFKAYEYTNRGNTVGIVTDGTAVLGLGDIGPRAALPVMEGKAILFKRFAGIDGVPVCLETKDAAEIIRIVQTLQPTFGGINLEDISAPRCFSIERRLKDLITIPVFHDDQHGTAFIVRAGLSNALKLQGRKWADMKVVVNGAGASGIAVANLLLDSGVKDLTLVDTRGIIVPERREGMNEFKQEVAIRGGNHTEGTLKTAMRGADIFVGCSVGNAVAKSMVRSMNDQAIVFALANPVPEISPEQAKEAGAAIIASGRSDYPNQVNNVLGFPGIFRGTLDVKATDITKNMIIAGSEALAALIGEDELEADYLIPGPLDDRVVPKVALAVARQAHEDGVARLPFDEELIIANIGAGHQHD